MQAISSLPLIDSEPLPRTIRPLAIANWLLAVATLVLIMVMVGGITRLTESGLSITEWKPVTGAIPPLTQDAWNAEFELYKQTGEFQNVTGPAGMDLAQFKFIYFWEWFHRLLGRLIGIAYFVPLVWFWMKDAIPSGFKPRLVFLLALGGLQGVFGWFMVKSGLSSEMTDVSHFWLSIHLCTAFLTLALLVWTALDMRAVERVRRTGDPLLHTARLTGLGWIIAAVVFVQILLGAWVAGLNAGLASDTWPLMQERFLPEYDSSRGFWYAMTHDPYLLHFAHRWWAVAALIAIVIIARKTRPIDRRASILLHSVVGTQILLGIATVMTGVALWIAVAHQVVGALLVASLAWALHLQGRAR